MRGIDGDHRDRPRQHSPIVARLAPYSARCAARQICTCEESPHCPMRGYGWSNGPVVLMY